MINRAHEGSERYELVARELARPTRFERRVLAKTFLKDHSSAHRDESHDLYRTVLQGNGATYCFLYFDEHISREIRRGMLKAICYVARGMFPQNKKVIGIGTEKRFGPSCSYDFCVVELPVVTSAMQREMDKLREQLMLFEKPIVNIVEAVEYPPSSH